MSFHVRTLRALLVAGLAFSSLQSVQAQTTVVKPTSVTEVKGVKIDYEEIKITGTPMPSITGTPAALRLIQVVRPPGIPSMMMMAASPTPSGNTIPNDSGNAISTNFAGMMQFFLPMLPYSRPAYKPTTTTSVSSVKPTSTTTRGTSTIKSTSETSSMLMQASMAESVAVDGGVVVGGSNTVNFTYGVEVFINEVGCGSRHAPTTLAYQIGSQAPVPLFGGNAVSTGMMDSFSIPATGEPLRFIATFAPVGGCPAPDGPRASDDPNQAMTFVNGQNVPDLLAAKNVTLQYQGQQPLPSRLAALGYIDSSGNATLPADKSVLVFEAAKYQTGGSFDMNDLGIVLTAPGPQAVDVVMQDTIGADTSATDGTLGLPTQISPSHTVYSFPVSLVTASENGTLSQLKLVGYDLQANAHPYNWIYEISFYSSLSAVQSAPLVGDIANYTFSPSMMTRVPFGSAPSVAFGTSTYLLTFDLSAQQIPVSAGQPFYVGFRVVTGAGADGLFRASTSTLSGAYDYIKTPGGIVSAQTIGFGRMAYSLSETVQYQPPIVGEKTQGAQSGMLQQ